jgi:hypothetical protein
MEAHVERRKHERFRVKDDAFVILRLQDSVLLGELIDISSEGLTLHYIAGEEPSNGTFKLNISLLDHDFCLTKVPFETITDCAMAVPLGCIPSRRRGVQFGELTDNQAVQLKYLIENYTSG